MDDLKTIYKALSEPLPDEAIQRTKGTDTRKGYDTTGYGYQYAVNRFNEVCGLDGWGYFYSVAQAHEGTFRSGATNWNIVTEMTIWVNSKENTRTMPGSHTASDYGDALKGAITNAFKKTAAMWGVGRQAYEGTLDDDNVPAPPVVKTPPGRNLSSGGSVDTSLVDGRTPGKGERLVHIISAESKTGSKGTPYLRVQYNLPDEPQAPAQWASIFEQGDIECIGEYGEGIAYLATIEKKGQYTNLKGLYPGGTVVADDEELPD